MDRGVAKEESNSPRDISAILSLFPKGIIFMEGAGEVFLEEARAEEAAAASGSPKYQIRHVGTRNSLHTTASPR